MKNTVQKIYTDKASYNKGITSIERNGLDAVEGLAQDLISKKIRNGSSVKRMSERNNYNGTHTTTVYYDNGVISAYTYNN